MIRIQRDKIRCRGISYSALDVYCLNQFCYELINVEEEGQILAFYELISQQRGDKAGQSDAEERYQEVRKVFRESTK